MGPAAMTPKTEAASLGEQAKELSWEIACCLGGPKHVALCRLIDRLAALATGEPPAPQAVVKEALTAVADCEFESALAAGDGTLHGAIDSWQERALAAEEKLRLAVGERLPLTVAEIEAIGHAWRGLVDGTFATFVVRQTEAHHNIKALKEQNT
jgi:hypothetical protein